MNRSTDHYSGYRSPRPWLDTYRRPVVDVPSFLTGLGLGALIMLGVAVLVSWRVGL